MTRGLRSDEQRAQALQLLVRTKRVFCLADILASFSSDEARRQALLSLAPRPAEAKTPRTVSEWKVVCERESQHAGGTSSLAQWTDTTALLEQQAREWRAVADAATALLPAKKEAAAAPPGGAVLPP